MAKFEPQGYWTTSLFLDTDKSRLTKKEIALSLKTLVQARKLSVLQQNTFSTHLRQAYEKHTADPRFSMTLGAKKVTVTPAAGLEKDLVRVIHEVE